MDEARLSPCRTCGKEISTNLAVRAKHRLAWVSVGCPNCGEADPHGFVEQEAEEILRFAREKEEEEQKKIDEELADRPTIEERIIQWVVCILLVITLIVLWGLSKVFWNG